MRAALHLVHTPDTAREARIASHYEDMLRAWSDGDTVRAREAAEAMAAEIGERSSEQIAWMERMQGLR